MPTYQYACTACDHRFEAVQSFTDAALTECPACSGTLRKVFSSVGIVFKGSGFYRTDSRSGSSSSSTDAAKSGDAAKAKSTGTSETKADSTSSASSSSSSTKSETPAA